MKTYFLRHEGIKSARVQSICNGDAGGVVLQMQKMFIDPFAR